MSSRRADVWIALALLAGAWGLRLAFAAQLTFPPLDDPAFYLQTARNLAGGRGLVSDVLWTYHYPFAAVTHASHEYWMPLATLLMAPWIKVLGDSLFVAQLPGTLCGALLVPLTFGLARSVEPRDRRGAVGAALLVLAAALPVYQSASTDSAAPFALMAAAALIAGAKAAEGGSARWGLCAGVLAGLAYLSRSDGLLVPALLGAWFLVRRGSWRERGALLGTLMVGFGLAAVPWWVRNWSEFGALQPISPAIGTALQDYAQLFNWRDPPTLGTLLYRGSGFIARLRLNALLHNLGVAGLIAFPFGLYGWLGCIGGDSRPVLRLGLAYALLLLVSTAIIFSVPTLAGLFYHSAGAFVPWLAVGAVIVIRRVRSRRRSLGFGLALLTAVLVIAQAVLAWPPVLEDARRHAQTFATASEWLRDHAATDEPVIASQAHSLNYASGRPAMSLPAGQELAWLRDLAQHYQARFVVITESFGLYPQELDDRLGADVLLRAEAPGLRIYELVGRP